MSQLRKQLLSPDCASARCGPAVTTCECVALDALPYDADDLRDGYRPPICGQPAVAEISGDHYYVESAVQVCLAHAEEARGNGADVEWYEPEDM